MNFFINKKIILLSKNSYYFISFNNTNPSPYEELKRKSRLLRRGFIPLSGRGGQKLEVKKRVIV